MSINITFHRSLAAAVALLAGLMTSDLAYAACTRQSWGDFERQLSAAQIAFQKRDPGPLTALWSRSRDASLMGANGGHEVGWNLVGPRLARISAAGGATREDQVLQKVVGADLGVIVQIETITAVKADGSLGNLDRLRVTHIARCEGGEWRLIHRHADRLVDILPGLPH